jgi:hypothetical protein
MLINRPFVVNISACANAARDAMDDEMHLSIVNYSANAKTQ